MSTAIEVLRSSVRPILTYVLAGAFIFAFVQPNKYDADMAQMLFQLNLISLGFWYGERALKNLGLKLGAEK